MHEQNSDMKWLNLFDAARLAALIEQFGAIGQDDTGGVTRLAFSPEDLAAREEFIRLLNKDFNLEIRMDILGNIFARRAGRSNHLPVIMSGSHLDSVRNGGRYDGPAGVFCALEAFRVMDLAGIETEHPFELAVFASEEPNEFGISTFGSRGFIGTLAREGLGELRDENGRNLADAVAFLGGDLTRMEEAVVQPETLAGFVELHIEQMPFLERAGADIGLVAGVTGIYREEITLEGEAGHGGTTPMDSRRDALAAAAKMILTIEQAAAEEKDTVATVGRILSFPNSINIIPGRVVINTEIRSFDPQATERIVGQIERTSATLEKQKGVKTHRRITYENRPIHFSEEVITASREAVQSLGFSSLDQISMAGHDAAHLGRITRSGMIFIPCRKGVSHCPEEFSDTESLLKGAQCLLKTLLILDQRL